MSRIVTGTPILVLMARSRVQEDDALRAWRVAERELVEAGDGRTDLEANVARSRDAYQRLLTDGMTENLSGLHEADARRAGAVPSTPDFHRATRDIEDIAADVWDQARHGDLDGPQGDEARANREQPR